MSTITVAEILNDPGGWLRRIESGESFHIVRDGRPVAEVKPSEPPRQELRPYGLSAGVFTVPDSFFDPLPDNILDAFSGK